MSPAACPRNCGTEPSGGGTCRPDGRCLSCNEDRLRVNGRCVGLVYCRGRRIQSGSMAGDGCRCLDDRCHYCNRAAAADVCRACRDGAYLLDGGCVAACRAGLASAGVGQFKRRCLAPFVCHHGRIVGADPDVGYGCKCATDDNAPAACQHCEFRADEFGQHCTRCLGGRYLRPDHRCHDDCAGTGLASYNPGSYGRACRPPFTCANRLDELGAACKCGRAVGRNDCAVCDFMLTGAVCIRCTNNRLLQAGTCVDACGAGETATGAGPDGRECV